MRRTFGLPVAVLLFSAACSRHPAPQVAAPIQPTAPAASAPVVAPAAPADPTAALLTEADRLFTLGERELSLGHLEQARAAFDKSLDVLLDAPDGARVAFAFNRHGPSEIYWTAADGGGGAEQLTTSDTIHLATSWSPDGRTLLPMSVNAVLNTDVLMWPQGGRLQPFLQTAFAEERAVFYPDGRWVA